MEQSLPQKYAALFIDAPNIAHQHIAGNEDHRVSIKDIDWEALVKHMLASLEADYFVFLGTAYTFAGDGRKDTADWLEESLRRGLGRYRGKVRTFVRSRKDIDNAIVNDMWVCYHRMCREREERGALAPHEITFLLAAGDGGYADPVGSIREFFGQKVDLRLHTFSWGGSLSGELSRMSQRVELLDHVAPLLIKPAFAL
ncbi:MAG: hypothetical protein ACREGR_03905 [Minisyncoccia bacterium]